MKNTKRLRSVIHSTAHHALSGLCYMHPHLGEHCVDAGLKSIRLDLLSGEYKPKFKKSSNELNLSTTALIDKYTELLKVEKINSQCISSASAEFKYGKDNWPVHCVISMRTSDGKQLEVEVSSMGEVGEILGKYE